MSKKEYDYKMNKLLNEKQNLINKKLEIDRQLDNVKLRITSLQDEMIREL
jgi:hypothetical protein